MRIRDDVSITRNKERNKWQVRWWGQYDPDTGKQKRPCKSFKTKKLAERYAAGLKRDKEDGLNIDSYNISLKLFTDKFLEAKKGSVQDTSLETYKRTINRLKKAFGDHCKIRSIDAQKAQQFINSIELQYKECPPSDSTRAKNLRNARLIFAVAVRWDYIRKNPFRDVTVGKIKRQNWHYITQDEFKAILQAIEEKPIRLGHEYEDAERKVYHRAFYAVMYGCGLRFGESVHLLWKNNNIDLVNKKINIINRPSANGIPGFHIKDYEARTIPCPSWVIDSLKKLKEFSSPENPYVFLTDEEFEKRKETWKKYVQEKKTELWRNYMMLNNTNPIFQRYCKRAGIVTCDKLSVHCLRKAYGTNLANLGTPAHTLMRLMGHSNIQTTMDFYIQTTDENMMKAVEGLEGMMEN